MGRLTSQRDNTHTNLMQQHTKSKPVHQLKEAALTGRIEGKRARGRQRDTLLGWLECATGFRPLDLIKMMKERREEEAVTAAYARVLARHTN